MSTLVEWAWAFVVLMLFIILLRVILGYDMARFGR